MKTITDKFISLFPILFGVFVILFAAYYYFFQHPGFVIYPPIKELSKSNELSINLVVELNKFLISISTALFGVAAFILTTYKKSISIHSVSFAFLLSLLLLGFAYFFGFKVYAEITANLAQGNLGLQPGNSWIFFYLETESILGGGASLVLMSIFVTVFYHKKFD
jgi:hypothetical protein